MSYRKKSSEMPGTVSASPVVEFYKDAKIFITGCTGFLGKALIEKVLRSCPSVDHIYLLIREKKGKTPQARIKDIFNDPLFKILRQEKPDFEKKVTCIPGDIGCERLGMSDNDYEFIVNEITHVFHSAATVRFNETLKSALKINVRGTLEITELCNKCTQLKVFIHVSTAYANCVRKEISENFYEPPLKWDKALRLLDTLDEEKLHSITKELIKPWPNTYAYTKAIAENIINEKAKSIPAAVFRPGIVMGSSREPIPGWIDNIYGPTGIIAAVGIGLMRVLYIDENTIANVIPVDLTVNALITCGWEAGCNFQNNAAIENSLDAGVSKTGTTPNVYNFVVDDENQMTWGDFVKTNLQYGINFPSEKAFWYYAVTLTKTKLMYLPLIFLLHYLPALFIDVALVLLGKKPQAIKAYKKIHTFSDAMGGFSTNHWHFSNVNIKKLWSHLNDGDKELFSFDMAALEWNTYVHVIIQGIRSYIFHEGDSTLPAARRKMFFLWLGHRILQFGFFAICFWVLHKIFFSFADIQTQFEDPILRTPELLKNST